MDIDLTEKGRMQAARAGKLLKLHGYEFDEAHVSVLKRAVRTLWTALHSSNQHWIPVRHTWRLNERHYGALTGLSKKEAGEQLGEDMLLKYRRGYAVEPLPMTEEHPCWVGGDRRYQDLGPLLPRGESLKQCKARILPYWSEHVLPSVRAGKLVLVAAHNNVIRCLCKHLDGIADDDLDQLEIPTGAPLVYHLDRHSLQPVGPKNAIGFSGTFLSDDKLMARERARRQAREARADLEPATTSSHHRAAYAHVATDGLAAHRHHEHEPVASSDDAHRQNAKIPTCSSNQEGTDTERAQQTPLMQPLPPPLSTEAQAARAQAKVKKAAAKRQQAMMAAAATGGPCTADLDAALTKLHAREYDLDGIVDGMRITDYVPAAALLAEANRLGLQPDAQHPGRFRSPLPSTWPPTSRATVEA